MNKLLGLFLLALAFLAPGGVEAANKFAFCPSGSSPCTWDDTNTPNIWFTATNGGGSATTAPTSSDTAIFDINSCNAVACTFNVGATINATSNTIQGITAGACTGATTGCFLNFASGNPNITITGNVGSGQGMGLTGTGTRKFALGSGTYTFTTTSGSVFDLGTTTNLDGTSTFSSAVFVLSATTASERQFSGGNQTYGSLTVSANTSGGGLRIFGNNSFSAFAGAPGTAVQFPTGTTTISAAGSMGAGSASSPILYNSASTTTGTTTLSFSTGTVTADWIGLVGITTTGSGTFTATNCLNFGRVTLDSGDTCTAPSAGGGGGGRIIGG